MGRINPNDAEKYEQSNNSDWLKLSNHGDVARVQFMYDSYDELDTFTCHKVKVGDYERWVDCKRDYDQPVDACPFCAAGIPVKPVMIVSMFDHKDNSVKIWERGKTFRKQLEAFFNRYPKLSDMVFEIERNGAAGDKKTTYQLFPMPDVAPIDITGVEKQDFLGTVIMDKTVDEMQTYLDTGEFPKSDDNSSQRNSQPTSRRGSGDTTSSRRSVSRRAGY